MNLSIFKIKSVLKYLTPVLIIGLFSLTILGPLTTSAQAAPPDGVKCANFPACPDGVDKNATFKDDIWSSIESYAGGGGTPTIVIKKWDINGNPIKSQSSNDKVVDTLLNPVGTVLNWLGNEALEGSTEFILNLLAYVTALIFTLGGWLIGLALRLNSEVLNMSAVQTGWTITRDLANLGFVLGIVVIAFGTILRSSNYGMRSLLTKFIIMALLINFSLVFAGIILDFAGILTVHFVNSTIPGSATGSWDDFATSISNVMRVDSLLQVRGDEVSLGQGLAILEGAFLKNVASLIFIIVFTILAALVFLGLAGMFLARFIALAILLVLMPMAWFSGIFPAINQSGKWWSSFLRWTFFAPVSTFFIYLSVSTLGSEKSDGGILSGISDASSGLASSLNSSTVIFDVLGQIGSMVVICGFLLGSLLASNVASKFGGDWAMGSAMGMKKWAINKTKQTTSQYASRAATSAARSVSKGLGLETWAENQQKAAREGRLGFLGKQIARFSQPIQQLQEAGGKNTMARYDSTVKNMNPDSYALNYQQAADPALKARIMKEAVDKGKLDKLGPIDAKDVKRFKDFGGNMKDLEKINVFYAEDDKPDKNISQLMADSIDKQGDELTEAITKLEKALSGKLSGMKPEDLSKGQWLKMVNDGVGSGMTKENWQGSSQKQALISAMAKNWKGKEFGKAFGDASLKNRREMSNRLLARSSGAKTNQAVADLFDTTTDKLKDVLKEKDFTEIKNSKAIEDAKKNNESLYNYITKTLNSIDPTKEEKDKPDDKQGIAQEAEAGQEFFTDESGKPIV